jgi:hypothetical protein
MTIVERRLVEVRTVPVVVCEVVQKIINYIFIYNVHYSTIRAYRESSALCFDPAH